jgi:uncharacterized membrane protein
MSVSAQALAAILAMAVVTYATRAAGLFLVGRMRLGPRAEAFLSAIPGAVVGSLVAPAVLTQGPTPASSMKNGVACRAASIEAKTRRGWGGRAGAVIGPTPGPGVW